ncbi:MAG: hypothetical protein ACYTHJ_09150 [Planctomycetota bacterium]|jgi:uncharacterized delta-60 repeat protein
MTRSKFVIGTLLAVISAGSLTAAAPGDLDQAFGVEGLASSDFGGAFDRVLGMAVTEGRIAAVGTGGPGNRFAIAVFDGEGQIDNSFVNHGQLVFNQTAGSAAVAFLPDDDILVGPAWLGSSFGYMIGRLNPDGSFQEGFGTDGITTVPMGSQPNVNAIAVQTDGKIILGGYSFFSGNWNWTFARFTENGTLDSSFNGGTVITDFGVDSEDRCRDFALQPDDRMIAVGESENLDGSDVITLARYNTSGALDDTFGDDGIVIIPAGVIGTSDRLLGVALQPDGYIVACGLSSGNSIVLRFEPDGDLDTTFGTDGVVSIPISLSNESLNDVAVDQLGRIIAGGSARINGSWRQVLVRLLPDGTVDGSFGVAGVVTADFGTPWEQAYAVALQDANRILLGGQTGEANVDYNFAISRYLNETGTGGATVEFLTDVDGEATSTNGSSFVIEPGEHFIAVDRSTISNTDSRGILEFHITGGVPANARIVEATLDIDIAGLSFFPDVSYPFIEVYGYAGNGILESMDADMIDDLIGVSQPITSQDPLTISLTNTEFIESLAAGGSTFLGLVLYAGRADHYAGFVASEGAKIFKLPAPRLTIEFTAESPTQADFDLDGDVDGDDYAIFLDCADGPASPIAPGCGPDDMDFDGDVDLADFQVFQQFFTGPDS